jgi:type IV pilus assembly protein PilW
MPGGAIRFKFFCCAYTLVELMIALALGSIFVLSTLTITTMSIHSYRYQENVSDVQQSIRAALDLMVRDIRMVGYDPKAISHGPSEGIGILVAEENMLQISSDLNADRFDSTGLENMTYFFDREGRRLRQKEGGRAYAQTFIDHVSALKFEYLNANGEPAVEKSDIAAVIVTLTVEKKNRIGVSVRRTLSTRVNCRNLRLQG